MVLVPLASSCGHVLKYNVVAMHKILLMFSEILRELSWQLRVK